MNQESKQNPAIALDTYMEHAQEGKQASLFDTEAPPLVHKPAPVQSVIQAVVEKTRAARLTAKHRPARVVEEETSLFEYAPPIAIELHGFPRLKRKPTLVERKKGEAHQQLNLSAAANKEAKILASILGITAKEYAEAALEHYKRYLFDLSTEG